MRGADDAGEAEDDVVGMADEGDVVAEHNFPADGCSDDDDDDDESED